MPSVISQFWNAINPNVMDSEEEVRAWLESLPSKSMIQELEASRRELEKLNDEYLETLLLGIKEGEEKLEENKKLGIVDLELAKEIEALRVEYDEYYPLVQAWKASWQ